MSDKNVFERLIEGAEELKHKLENGQCVWDTNNRCVMCGSVRQNFDDDENDMPPDNTNIKPAKDFKHGEGFQAYNPDRKEDWFTAVKLHQGAIMFDGLTYWTVGQLDLENNEIWQSCIPCEPHINVFNDVSGSQRNPAQEYKESAKCDIENKIKAIDVPYGVDFFDAKGRYHLRIKGGSISIKNHKIRSVRYDEYKNNPDIYDDVKLVRDINPNFKPNFTINFPESYAAGLMNLKFNRKKEFLEHLARSSDIVKDWPDWAKKMLGGNQ